MIQHTEVLWAVLLNIEALLDMMDALLVGK